MIKIRYIYIICLAIIVVSCNDNRYYIKNDVEHVLIPDSIEYEKVITTNLIGDVTVNPMVSIYPYVIIADKSKETNLKLFEIKEDSLVLIDNKLKSGKGPGECVSCDRIFSNDKDLVYQFDFYMKRINSFRIDTSRKSLVFDKVFPHFKDNATYDIKSHSDSTFISTDITIDNPFFISNIDGELLHKMGDYPKEATEEDVPNTYGQLYFGYFCYNKEKDKIAKIYLRDNRIDIYDLQSNRTTSVEGIFDYELKYEIFQANDGPHLASKSKYYPFGAMITSDNEYIYCVSEDEFKNQFILKMSWDINSYELYQIDKRFVMEAMYYDRKAGKLSGLEYDTKNESFRYVLYKI